MFKILVSCYMNVEDEFRSLIAWGMKLLRGLVVLQQILILLYLLPDGSWVDRLWPDWVLSFSIIYGLYFH